MQVTVQYVKSRFDYFNDKMFGGRLESVPIAPGDAAGYLGKCEFRRRLMPDGSTVSEDFVLRINTRFDLPADVIDDAIIHEMIHYFVECHQLKDTSPHGSIFKALMASINAAYGRNVSVTHRMDAPKPVPAKTPMARKRVVAVVTMENGRTGIKVLPHVGKTIANYCRQVSRSPGVKKVELYLSANGLFANYPASGALKVYYLDAAVIVEALRNDSRLLDPRTFESLH